MKFVKEKDEKRRDYIFQKNTKTKLGANFIIIVLVLLMVGVLISGIYMNFF